MIGDEVYDRLLRHVMGPLEPYYDDPSVTEIMINGPREVFVDGKRGVVRVPETLEDAAALRAMARVILQFSGKRLDPLNLSLEARTPSRARVHIVQDPAARAGITIAIRKFAADPPTLDDLEASGSLSRAAIDYLGTQVRGHRNIIISGGTGTGKTTLLGILARMIESAERILTIEDVAELDLRMPHVVQLESQMPDGKGRGGITIRELFRAALRMRPDRILVGECRGGEALDMIQAMNSGHAGSLSTVHADDPARALSRLETMCLMSDADVPLIAVRRQIIEAIDLVVQVRRTAGKRQVVEIAEVGSDDRGSGAYPVRTLFSRAGPEADLVAVASQTTPADRAQPPLG